MVAKPRRSTAAAKAAAAQQIRVRCGDCQIRHRAVCAQCNPDELSRLDDIKSYRSFKAGEVIAMAGHETDVLGSVVNGVASLSRVLSDGRRQLVGMLLPSDFVGRPMRPVAPYDVTALTDVTLCLFDRARFEAQLRETPALEMRLLEMMLDELDAAREWMVLLGRKTAKEKIASLLLLLMRRTALLRKSAPSADLVLELPLSREDMGDHLGLTIETVSRQFGQLKKDGVIKMIDARHLTVPDFARLQELAGDDADGGLLA